MKVYLSLGVASLGLAVLLCGCGGGSGGGSTPPPQSTVTAVSVSCSPSSIATDKTSSCISTVSGTGSYSSAVTWSVSPSSIGSISSAGVFTPTGAGTATITATSAQDATKSGAATVTVTAASTISSVTVTCSPTSIVTGQTSTCTATVTGTGAFSSAVTWSATDGSITSSGVFTPTASGTATITATSTQDATKSGAMSIAVANATALTVTISDLPTGMLGNVTVTAPNGQQVTLTSSQTVNATPGTYTITAIPVSVGTNTYHATQPTQTVSVAAGATATAIIDYFDIIPATTKVLDQAGAQSLSVSPDGSTLTISSTSGVAQSLEAGDVLVSAPTTSAPNGLLVNILNVSNKGATVTANVSPATLEEAIQQGSLSFTQTFLPNDSQNLGNLSTQSRVLTVQEARKAGILYDTGSLSNSCSNDANTFIEPFSYTIGAQGGISAGDIGDDASGQVWLDGTLEFCPQLQVNVKWGFLSVKSASVVASFGEHSLLTLKGQLSATVNVEQDLANIPLSAPTVVLIGEVPVVVQGQAIPYLGANLGSSASFYASAEQDAQAQAGLDYANGVATPVLAAPTFSSMTTGTSLDGSITGQVYFGLKAGVLVYGTLFPNIATDVYVRGAAGPPETLSWGAESNVGVDMSIFDTDLKISLNSPEVPIKEETIWQESGSFDPTLQSITPNAADVGSPDLKIALVGSNFVPDSVVNFNGIALSTTFSDPDDISATIPASSLLTPGSYTVTVVSPDTLGAVSNAVTFVINGPASNPVPTIKSLLPASLPTGSPAQILTIDGTGFLPASTVAFNGAVHAATFISASQLTISLTSADLAKAGTYPVFVTNPAPGGGASAAVNFSVTPKAANGGEWTWMSGSSTLPDCQTGTNCGQPGVYGTLGAPASGNIPGSRLWAATWTDNDGNLWLFGGEGFDISNTFGPMNDIWKFAPSTSQWTWMGGSSTTAHRGVFGTLGTPASGNIPGSRVSAVTWTDTMGNLWLFGGSGLDANGIQGYLNDLWEFTPSTSEWTWMGGSNSVKFSNGGQPGVYGTLGVPSAENIPGGRTGATSWTDKSGNFWLFGGEGYSADAPVVLFNDVWKFDSSTKQWTWMGGSSTVGANGGQAGVYGMIGILSVENIPGSRAYAASWIDHSGDFWLLGGYGFDASGFGDQLNDLWEFTPPSNQWAWMSGSSLVGQNCDQQGNCGRPGIYGTIETGAAANAPGGRSQGSSATDSSDHLWTFGGFGADANDTIGALNDLWEFNPSTNLWTWMAGSSTLGSSCDQSGNCGHAGVYGTLGTPATVNIPGSRLDASAWTDSSGNLWLFGGEGFDANGNLGYLNDVWRYQP